MEGSQLKIDFKELLSDTYDLFLPLPVFSVEKIELTLEVGVIYSDVFYIDNIGEGSLEASIETEGFGLTVTPSQIKSNKEAVTYQIDTRSYYDGEKIEGAIILTYLGGEKRLPLLIHLVGENQRFTEKRNEAPMRLLSKKEKAKALFQIDWHKKVYTVEEKAKLVILNKGIYPIAVKWVGGDKDLFLEKKMVTVDEIGFLEVTLKRSLFSRIQAKYRRINLSIIERRIKLEIRTELGISYVEKTIKFINDTICSTKEPIGDQRSYKEVFLRLQQRYREYILMGDQKKLELILPAIHQNIAYNAMDIHLRLFHIGVLMALREVTEVEKEIQWVLNYQAYYEKIGEEEIIEVLQVLSNGLRNEEVWVVPYTWTLTAYQYFFKIQLLNEPVPFEELEELFEQDQWSAIMMAVTVKQLREAPMVPIEASPLYKRAVQWALNKNKITLLWIECIENHGYQIRRYSLLSSYQLVKLYLIGPSKKLLKLLCQLLIDEDNQTEAAYIYYEEALRQKIYIKELATIYVQTGVRNRQKIKLGYIQLIVQKEQLNHDQLTYVFLEYTKGEYGEYEDLSLIYRQYQSFVKTCIHKNMTGDEKALVFYESECLLEKYDWMTLKQLLQLPMIQYIKKHHLSMVNRLIEQGFEGLGVDWLEKNFGQLRVGKVLTGEKQRLYIKKYLTADVAIAVIKARYEQGDRTADLLQILARTYRGTLNEALILFEQLIEMDVYESTLAEWILYKGIRTRQAFMRVYQVYQAYRHKSPKAQVTRGMNRYLTAQILIEETSGLPSMIDIFEMDLHTEKAWLPMGLALLKLYKIHGVENKIISDNLIKNSVKNGIIFPWFAELAVPFLKATQFRKVAFFSYNSGSHVQVKLYYKADDQDSYKTIKMKHVGFGLYIGYVVAFYQDYIAYYFREETTSGAYIITESGLYIHDYIPEPLETMNGFDTINTLMMGQMVGDERSIEDEMQQFIQHREMLRHTLIMV